LAAVVGKPEPAPGYSEPPPWPRDKILPAGPRLAWAIHLAERDWVGDPWQQLGQPEALSSESSPLNGERCCRLAAQSFGLAPEDNMTLTIIAAVSRHYSPGRPHHGTGLQAIA
jgi:hypothetical protein